MTNAACNLSFLRSIELLPICSAFCALLLITPLSIVYEKGTNMAYGNRDKCVILFAVIGYMVILYPWSTVEIVGGSFGLISLYANFMYEKNFSELHSSITVMEITFVSNFLLLILALPLAVVEGISFPGFFAWICIFFSGIFYTLSLLIIQRLSELIDDEVLRLLYIN